MYTYSRGSSLPRDWTWVSCISCSSRGVLHLVAQVVKNLPAMQETQAQSPGSGRSLGGGHGSPFQYSCLEKPHRQSSLVGYSSWCRKESDTMDRLTLSLSLPLVLPGKPHIYTILYIRASLIAQLVKNPPAMQETWFLSLDWEDLLEKGTTTHSSILAWRIPWTVESMGSQRGRHDWATFTFTFFHFHSIWNNQEESTV